MASHLNMQKIRINGGGGGGKQKKIKEKKKFLKKGVFGAVFFLEN